MKKKKIIITVVTILGVLGSIASIISIVMIYGKDILNVFPYIAIIIKNGIGTALGVFSAFLFLVSLFWVVLFRHEVRKVKAATDVFLLLGLIGFIVSGLIHVDYRMPEDATPMISELKKEKEALQRELVTSKETIRQKENENALVKREKEKLGKEVEIQKNQSKVYGDTIQQKENENALVKQEKEKLAREVETQKQQNKTYGDTIAQKDKEISNLNKQLTDSLSEVKKLTNKIALLEKENQNFQDEVSNLKKSSIPQQVSFEYVNYKLFLIDGDKRKELLTRYLIHQYSMSKNRKTIAVIGGKGSYYYDFIVFNADRDLSDLSSWEIVNHATTPPKNLKWVSDKVLRIDLIQLSGLHLSFHKISLEGTGTYDITINEINSW